MTKEDDVLEPIEELFEGGAGHHRLLRLRGNAGAEGVVLNQREAWHVPESAMPSFWTHEDTKNALLASLIPGGTALLGAAVYCTDRAAVEWWEKLRKPQWVTPNRVKAASVVDVLAGLPVGYASYLCYKHGGGFDYNDTRVALGLYGLNIAAAAACIPLVKKRNLNGLAVNMWVLHGSAVAAAIAFFKIHKPAGYWLVPYAVWTGFYLYLVHAIKKENDPVKNL